MGSDDVLDLVATRAVLAGTRMVEPGAIERDAAAHGMSHDELFRALVDLRDRALVQLATAEPSQVVLLAVTDAGLLAALPAGEAARLEARVSDAAAAAVGQGAVPLAEQLGEPALLVECVLDSLVRQRRLVYSKAPGRRFRIHKRLSPGR